MLRGINQRFDEGESDADVIAKLGSPTFAAVSVLRGYVPPEEDELAEQAQEPEPLPEPEPEPEPLPEPEPEPAADEAEPEPEPASEPEQAEEPETPEPEPGTEDGTDMADPVSETELEETADEAEPRPSPNPRARMPASPEPAGESAPEEAEPEPEGDGRRCARSGVLAGTGNGRGGASRASALLGRAAGSCPGRPRRRWAC